MSAHAVRNANGDLSVLLVNKDPVNPYQVNLHYAGFTPAAQGSAASQLLPPYSIETVVLQPQAGTESALSVPSTPVRFTTSTPANGPSPIDGWTLAFSFPAASESISSNWNGNWTENGQAVTVTNLSWDGPLAASGGNTVDIGFVGANDGAYPSPAAFTLNGTVCSTMYSS